MTKSNTDGKACPMTPDQQNRIPIQGATFAEKLVPRRGFLAGSVAVSLAAAGQHAMAAGPEPAASGENAVWLASTPSSERLGIGEIPNFCSHEHWGSIDSIGMVAEGFRADVEQGATPKRRTGLFDILLDPYFRGMLAAAGVNPDALAKATGAESFQKLAESSAAKALGVLRPALRVQELTGTYQCIRRGLLDAHGFDLEGGDDAVAQLDASIARQYERIFDWYMEAMRKAGFSELIRPVHPEFFVRRESPQTAAREARFTHTILRIDPLLDFWKHTAPRREALAEVAGVDPVDAASWRQFLGRLFDLGAEKRTTGIKQLQAYSRPLEFRPVADTEPVWRGELDPDQVRTFQDWVVHECCKQAHDRGWPHQVHVGTHNLTQSSPLPLGPLAVRYRRMKIVQIHCWPFLREAGWLAKHHPNVYVDTCWLPVLSPAYFREAMATWLNYVPASKIMCSHDSTSIEMAIGSSLFTREILGQSLVEHSRSLGMAEGGLRRIAADLLHNNAVAVYGVGEHYTAP
jgi:predicted TIM-barrel fold metal-dependent hydrolase